MENNGEASEMEESCHTQNMTERLGFGADNNLCPGCY